MNNIKFEFLSAKELIVNDLKFLNYISGYNKVFNKNFDGEYFQNKYLNPNGQSFHLLALDENSIIGAFTMIKSHIAILEERRTVWMCCDTFIIQEYRKDEFLLKKMFQHFNQNTPLDKFQIILAIPNEKAALYWEKIIKWKNLTEFKVQMLPTEIIKPKILRIVLFILIAIASIPTYFFIKKKVDLHVIRDNNFFEYRFRNGYKLEDKNHKVFSKIYKDGKFKVKYLFGLEELNIYQRLKVLRKIFANSDSDLLAIGSTQNILPFIAIPNFVIKRTIMVMYYTKDGKEITAKKPFLNLDFFDNR